MLYETVANGCELAVAGYSLSILSRLAISCGTALKAAKSSPCSGTGRFSTLCSNSRLWTFGSINWTLFPPLKIHAPIYYLLVEPLFELRLSRSSGLVLCSLVRCWGGKPM